MFQTVIRLSRLRRVGQMNFKYLEMKYIWRNHTVYANQLEKFEIETLDATTLSFSVECGERMKAERRSILNIIDKNSIQIDRESMMSLMLLGFYYEQNSSIQKEETT